MTLIYLIIDLITGEKDHSLYIALGIVIVILLIVSLVLCNCLKRKTTKEKRAKRKEQRKEPETPKLEPEPEAKPPPLKKVEEDEDLCYIPSSEVVKIQLISSQLGVEPSNVFEWKDPSKKEPKSKIELSRKKYVSSRVKEQLKVHKRKKSVLKSMKNESRGLPSRI